MSAEERLPVEDNQPKTLWNYNFIMVLVFGFLSGTANQMINPLLSTHITSLGASLSTAGFIVGLQSGMAMFLRPLSGAASDILNRKYVMIGSIVVSSVAFTGYLFFDSIPAAMICRMLQGFSFAFMSVARTAFATEYMPKDRMGEGVAMTTFGIVLSQAVGPAVGLWLYERWGFDGCLIAALAFSVSGIVLLSTLPYKHVKGEFKSNRLKLSNLIAVEVIPYGILGGLFAMITHLANTFVNLIGEERGIANVALYFTVYSISALAIRPFVGKVVDKRGLAIILYPAFICAAASFITLGAAQGLLLVVISALFKTFSQGVALPSIQGSSIKRMGKERAGVASATIHMGQDFICWLAPFAGGHIAKNLGYGTMYYIFAVIVLMGIPFFMLIRRNEKKKGII